MHKIRLVNSTGALILEKAGESDYIDYQFINKFQLKYVMTMEEIEAEAHKLAQRNNLSNYSIDLTDYRPA